MRFRRRYTLGILLVLVPALGVDLAWMPWPTCAFLAVAIVLPALLSEVTLLGWCVIYGIIGFLAGLFTPIVLTDHPRGLKPAAAPATLSMPPTEPKS
jgi:hypothetical protein